LYLFADDAKMYCHMKELADKDKLQKNGKFRKMDKQIASLIKHK